MKTKKAKAKKFNPTTTIYLKERTNPANPNDHDKKAGEFWDFRKLFEVASRAETNDYSLSEKTDKATGAKVLYLAGRYSKIVERFTEQWLLSLGLVKKVGSEEEGFEYHVIKEKLDELVKQDNERLQQLIREKNKDIVLPKKSA